MKKFIFCSIACLGLAFAAQADTYGPFEYWANKSSGYVVIIDCDDEVTEAVIPTEIEGLPVTGIQAFAFQDCTSLVSITIPETVTWTGQGAFENCSKLATVILPDSLQTMSQSGTFSGCSSLTSITLPDNLTDLYYGYHFQACTSLESVRIGSNTGVNSALPMWSMFDGCTGISTVEVDEAHPLYTSINGVVYNKALTTLVFVPRARQGAFAIPETVTTVEGFAFEDCVNLTSITIPDSVTEIQANFVTCASLTEINVGANNPNYSSIDGVLFDKSGTVLHKVPPGRSGEYQVPDGVTDIGGLTNSFEYGFAGCWNLTGITISSSVTAFRHDISSRRPWFGAPFTGCTSLTRIDVNEANASYASVDGVLFNKDLTTLFKLPPGYTGSYAMPDTVTSLGGEYPSLALESGLDTVIIGNGLASLIAGNFSGCEALTGIEAAEAHPNYASVDGVLFSKDLGTLEVFPRGRGGNYNIPDGTTSIGGGAFRLSRLSTVVIPESVSIIGGNAFEECPNLTDVTIGNGVTSIGEWAFFGCTSLNKVTISDSVTAIGEYAFLGCTNLASITIGDGVASIENSAFVWCRSLASLTLPDSVTSLGNHVFDGCRSLSSLNLGNGLASIGSNTFANCIYLTEATIPASMVNMDGGAFNFCSNLRRVYFLGEPPVSGLDQFGDTHSDLVAYYIQETPGWGDTYGGAPTAPFLLSWGPFVPTPSPNGIYVDTGGWLGWLDISLRPWVWCHKLEEWLYIPEPIAAGLGDWIFFPQIALEMPSLSLYMVEGTNYGWSYSLKKWLYVSPITIETGSGWVYML